jgi:hypothetical protein
MTRKPEPIEWDETAAAAASEATRRFSLAP